MDDREKAWHWETRLNQILKNERNQDGGYRKDLTGCNAQVMKEVTCLDQKSPADYIIYSHSLVVVLGQRYISQNSWAKSSVR